MNMFLNKGAMTMRIIRGRKLKFNVFVGCFVTIFIIALSAWLLMNRTNNVFEEMYYSEYPSFFAGITKTSMRNIDDLILYPEDFVKELDGKAVPYLIPLEVVDGVMIEVEKGKGLLFGKVISNDNYTLICKYKYVVEEKTLYFEVHFKEKDTEEIMDDETEIWLAFLEDRGMENVSIEELREKVLNETVEKWLAGNKKSKFTMEDWGEFKVAYQ